jgi:hypothetical protein
MNLLNHNQKITSGLASIFCIVLNGEIDLIWKTISSLDKKYSY